MTGDYADVNGLRMYYETHGPSGGTPLVLVHGALSATGTSFGAVLPGLAEKRRVISVEFQAHGRTADIPGRPLRIPTLAQDVAAFIDQLGEGEAPVDLFGYSVGASVAAEVAIRRPELVRRLVLASVGLGPSGLHPGVLDGIEQVNADLMVGSPFEQEYLRIAPQPERWPDLIEKVKDLDLTLTDLTPEEFASIAAPTLLIAGDSDIVTLEHTVMLFRLLGGGVMGMPGAMPRSRLAILPSTSHVDVAERPELMLAIVPPFLDSD
jgi:pimeloyl-ACP methyl ester carboxylesterase